MANYNSRHSGKTIDDAVSVVNGASKGIIVSTNENNGKSVSIQAGDGMSVANGDGQSAGNIIISFDATTRSIVDRASNAAGVRVVTLEEYNAIDVDPDTLYLVES